MIKYNLNNINDWNFGEDNIIKVYRNNAVCYYKVTSGDTPTPVQEPCFAVVDNISQYSDTEFEDVFNLADEKWYKLNNLNQYEEYGIYGEGRNITYYDGKLTVDEEASPSRLPDGYTEVEYIENTSTSYINTDLQIYSSTTNSFEVEAKLIAAKHDSQTYQNVFSCMSEDGEPYQGFTYRYQSSSLVGTSIPNGQNTFTIVNNEDSTQTVTVASSSSQRTYTHTYPLTLFCGLNSSRSPFRWTNSKFYYCKIKINDELVRDLVPCKRDSDDKYGMFDIVNDVFYVSPNNVDFSGGEPIAPTKTYEYIYSGGSWINVGEVSGSTASLPEVSFVLNYNAKDYDATTHSILQTSGQSKAVNAIQNYGSNTIVDHSAEGYISVTANTRLAISGGTTPMYRTNTQTGCTMTIVSKVRTVNVNQSYSILTCRGGTGGNQMNWMWRYPTNGIFLHGSSSYNSVTYYTTTSASPITASVRVSWDGSVKQQINDWTNNGSYSGAFQYGSYSSTVNSNGSLFCDYLTNNGEFWKGDFYWVYMSQEVLTDEQIQQVINYNEGGGGQPIYPLEYVVREDPPNNLVFSSMTEAEDYECPWVGMKAKIDGDNYVFSGDSTSGYEWVYNPSRLPVGYTEVEYIENTGTSYFNTNFVPNQDTRVVCDMQMVVTSTDYPRLWGAGAWNSATGLMIDYENGYLQVSWFGNTSWTKYTSVATSTDRRVYDLNKNYIYIDNVLIGSSTYTTKTASDPIAIFTYISGGRPASSDSYLPRETFKGKMFSFQIYDNGTLIRDLVPCKRDNDNTVGAYDIVNDVFYTVPTGYTTDKLVAGSPV